MTAESKANAPALRSGLPISPAEATRLRQLLVARYGVELGAEVWQDAIAYAWEHRVDLAALSNPTGFLYRVAQSAARRHQRWRRSVALPAVPPSQLPEIEPKLPEALAALSPQQRSAVLLVHAYGWTLVDAAAALGIGESTLRNHLRRGLRRLQRVLGVNDE